MRLGAANLVADGARDTQSGGAARDAFFARLGGVGRDALVGRLANEALVAS